MFGINSWVFALRSYHIIISFGIDITEEKVFLFLLLFFLFRGAEDRKVTKSWKSQDFGLQPFFIKVNNMENAAD